VSGVSARRWFERAYLWWLWKKWRVFVERHRLIGLLLSPLVAVTFMLVTGLLLIVEMLVEVVKRR
jgi:hypothetical protein